MARFYGVIGFATHKETSPGVWKEDIKEISYYGDVLKIKTAWQQGEHLNDDLTVNHRISFVADQYALMNFPKMRYVSWMGAKWKIRDVEPQRPRLIITLGGVYNE